MDLRTYMSPFLPGMVFATFLAVVLGLISTVVYTLLGPTIQILLLEQETSLTFAQMLGPKIAMVIETFTSRQSVSSTELWQHLPWVLLALAGLRMLFGMSHWFMWERYGEKVSRRIRSDIMKAFLKLDPRARQSFKMEGDLSSNLTNDVRLLREYVVHFYGGFPRQGLQLAFFTVSLLALSPTLFGWFFLVITPAALVLRKLGKKIIRRTGHSLGQFSLLSEWIQQRLLGIETIKHYRTEAAEIEAMRALNQDLYNRDLKAERAKARTAPYTQWFAIVGLVFVLYLALNQSISGIQTGSILMSFFATLAVWVQAAGQLGKYINSNREGYAALDRLRHLLSQLEAFETPDQPESAAPKTNPVDAKIDCKGLTIRYEDKTALEGFDFAFERGKIYTIQGPSGAGKSTLFKGILGLTRLNEGSVTFDADLGFLPQDILLFPGTVLDNVIYPHTEGDRDKALEALRHAGVDTLVEDLPDGLDTYVGSGGRTLSGGETQRLGMARLFYHRYPFVLIDEGTSALDPESEERILSGIKLLRAGGTGVLMIAHRPSTAAIGDVFLKLQDGRLVTSAAP